MSKAKTDTRTSGGVLCGWCGKPMKKTMPRATDVWLNDPPKDATWYHCRPCGALTAL